MAPDKLDGFQGKRNLMNRNDIIISLKKCIFSEADHARMCDRFQQCNVRAVMSDGSTVERNDVRGPGAAAEAMQDDPKIAHFEYNYNCNWTVAC